MSDGGLSDVVVDEVSEQVAVGDLINGESIEEQVDASEVGASIGREFGAAIGRDLGEAIGREVHRALSEGAEEGKELREIAADVKEAVLSVLRTLLESFEGRESLRSFVTEISEDGLGDRLTDAAPTDVLEDEDETELEDEAEAETDVDVNLEDLRQETLEDFLSLMSYEDLQSVAKDVGVKANLSREEMTDRIIDAVDDSAATTESS
ncbi:hypothetical protein ACYJ1Y_14690 [Natrialbaceae archaeon A-gly3]